MGLPLFDASSDPGPSFFQFAQTQGLLPELSNNENERSAHATTVIALKYSDGVIMVADRQATSYYVANRDVKKIAAADRFTGLAISGSAARGIELLKIAQLSFEHYEKMTDNSLSLEGKANYLSPIVQANNFSSPMTVIPLLAGFDLSTQSGRVFEYDGAGGCYERNDFATIGSGSIFADGALRLGFRPDLAQDEALRLAILALYEAGDNDPSTGGPDFVRGIFPMVVTVTKQGFVELSSSVAEQLFTEIRDRRTASKGVAGGSLK